MTRRVSRSSDRIEQGIETALDLGGFVGYRGSFSFVSGLDQIANEIRLLISSDAKRAVALYEMFLGGAYEKAEEIDDSDGTFGDFVGELFCNWVRARQASGAHANETAALVIARMDDDDYGFTHAIERELAKALDREGRAAFERYVVKHFQDAVAAEKSGQSRRYESLHWARVLRALYIEQRALDKYVALCEGTTVSADDCATIARMLQSRRKTGEALSWVERGIALQREKGRGPVVDLLDLKRALLVKSGRPGDALQSAWSEFENDPNRFTYEELMRYAPKRDAAIWRERAMSVAEKNGALADVIDLWLRTRQIDRLVARLRMSDDAEIEGLSHYVTEPAAAKIEQKHPEIAARLYRALGMRIVKSKKSEYYAAALRHLKKARDCYARGRTRRHMGRAGLTCPEGSPSEERVYRRLRAHRARCRRTRGGLRPSSANAMEFRTEAMR